MKTHKFKQGSDEWFKVRLGKLTASSAQAIASKGKGLDTLVFEKVAEIITKKPKPSFTNGDIERGKEFESMARNAYELETSNRVIEAGSCEFNRSVGASPDGFIGKDGLVEIKCKNDTNFVRYLYDGKIDPAHVWQMQMQMFVTGREWVDYVIFNENFDPQIIIKRVNRNESEIAKIKAGLSIGIAQIETILAKIK